MVTSTTAPPPGLPDAERNTEPQSTTAPVDVAFYRAPAVVSSTETLQIERDSELYARVVSRLTTPGQTIRVEDVIDLGE
jgi:hypothetical protein